MDLFFKLSPVRPSGVPARRTPRLAACLFLGMFGFGCADTGATDDSPDSGTVTQINLDAGGTTFDAGVSNPFPGFDASAFLDAAGLLGAVDSGFKPAFDAGTPTTTDAGGTVADASTTADSGGFMIPNLFPDAGPAKDAGTTPSTDGGTTGGRDVHGPCKDLNLICFDGFDMFLNAECQTCNSGKGCAGCLLPFAY